MKTRNGFVSNSSSSSFCILGFKVNSETYEKIAYKPVSGEKPDDLIGESSISYEGSYYLGYYPSQMREDETLGQFKDRIVAKAAEIGLSVDKKDLDWHTDGGYNG